MTVAEFKKKYPHYSHLEGNALWDAMEMAVLNEQKNEPPKEITDWMGNKIKDGDTVCFIAVKKGYFYHNYKLLIPQEDSSIVVVDSDVKKEKEKKCWIVGKYFKVFEKNGHLCYNSTLKDNGLTFEFENWLGVDFFDEYRILAIKGVSDNREEYEKTINNK